MKNIMLKSCASAMVLAVATASAQEAPSVGTETVVPEEDTIIVTGQKMESTLQEVTASVEVVTGEEIAREPVSDLYDLVDRIPNVTTSFGDLGFSIRGIDQRGVGGSGRGQTLTIYVDDASLGNYTTFFGPLDTWDIGQVEVYRGPQSTNFGRNALAGAIYVRTQDPSYESDLKIRLEAGEYGTYQAAIAGGGGIVEDKLAWRGAAQYRESDGFIENIYLNEDADATELKSGRFKLLIEPTEALSIVTTTSYTENFAGEDGVNPAYGFAREADYDVLGHEGTETFLQSVNARWQITDRIELQSITAYQSTDYTRIEDYDVTPAPISILDRVGEDESFSQELRLKYAGDRLSGVAGVYYTDTSTDYDDSFTIPLAFAYPSLPLDNLVQRDAYINYTSENYAFFLDGEYALTETVDLLFGGRYDHETEGNDAIADTQVLGDVPPPYDAFLEPLTGETIEESETDFDAFLPKAGLRWTPRAGQSFAFVVQKAYRAGGSEISSLDGSVTLYDPEYLWNYELSSRSILLDGRLRWNSNVYYADWQDQQVSLPLDVNPNFYVTVNAGASTIYGVETDLTYAVNSGLEIYGGLGYAHTEFDDFPNPNAGAGAPSDFDGNTFPFAPELSANAGVDYEAASGFFAGLDVSYQSESYSDQENVELNEVKERTLVNGRLGYAFTENYRLSVIGRNLLDEDYYTFLNRDRTGGGFARVGDPRVVSVRLDVTF